MKRALPLILLLLAFAAGGMILWHSFFKNESSKEIKIGINLWPGYEFLYLAEKKGFFKEQGLNVRLLQFGSLGDVRLAMEGGQIDGMTTSVIEVLQVYSNIKKILKIVLIADYSNGADLILAKKPIRSIQDLKGKKLRSSACLFPWLSFLGPWQNSTYHFQT